jgi:hypothetical protein
MQQKFVRRVKSITGTALIGLGIFVFYENLHQAASHLLGIIPKEALGVLSLGPTSHPPWSRRAHACRKAGRRARSVRIAG